MWQKDCENLFLKRGDLETCAYNLLYVLWFKGIFGLNFFKPVLFLFLFVSDYDNEFKTLKVKIKLV